MLPILFILTAAFAVLAWSDTRKALLLLAAVLPSYLLRTNIFGIPTTLLELLVVVFITIWFMKHKIFHVKFFNLLTFQRKTKWGFLYKETALPIILLLLAATLAVFVAPNRLAALGIWKAYFIEPILLFLIIRYELHNKLHKEKSLNLNGTPVPFTPIRIFQALGVSAVILSIVAIIQYITGAGIPIPWDIERRVTSIFNYPNALGLFLGPIVIISFLSLRCHEWTKRAEGSQVNQLKSTGIARNATIFFWTSVVSLSFVAILLAKSEAAIVSIIATLFIVELFKRKTRTIAIGGLVIVLTIAMLIPTVREKLLLRDYSGRVRLSQWSETIDMLGDHWLLGAGLSGYPSVFEPYHKATNLEIFQYPHNILLNIWVELGLLGLAAFGLLAWLAIKPLTPSIAFFALTQMTIHGLVDVPYFKNDLAILTWILLAILFSYDRLSTSRTSSRR